MPKPAQTPVQRLTTIFLDLDGGEMETVIDIFKAIYNRRTKRLTPAASTANRPAQKPQAAAKSKLKPSSVSPQAAQSEATA